MKTAKTLIAAFGIIAITLPFWPPKALAADLQSSQETVTPPKGMSVKDAEQKTTQSQVDQQISIADAVAQMGSFDLIDRLKFPEFKYEPSNLSWGNQFLSITATKDTIIIEPQLSDETTRESFTLDLKAKTLTFMSSGLGFINAGSKPVLTSGTYSLINKKDSPATLEALKLMKNIVDSVLNDEALSNKPTKDLKRTSLILAKLIRIVSR